MSTIIYPSPIYGPVHSRRLGISLGINLMPADGKICTFDCIYCECGYNSDRRTRSHHPSRQQVAEALERQLRKMHDDNQHPDVLTFPSIIDDTIRLRDELCPIAKVSVLSNSTFITKPAIRETLMRVDNNILKLDTVNADYIRRVDRPTQPSYNVDSIIENMKLFEGHIIVQTMFMRGTTDEGLDVDNTSEDFVAPWLEAIKDVRPQEVMIYTIDRETPDSHLLKATHEELDAIKARVETLGIPCTASY